MAASRVRRILIISLAFMTLSLYHIIANSGDIILKTFDIDITLSPPNNNNTTTTTTNIKSISINRLEYIRTPGNKEELLQIFQNISNNNNNQALLPKTAIEIAKKYNIPETSRDITCIPNTTTTIGYIPSSRTYYNTSLVNTPYEYSGRIPKLIFQSWKTNDLSYELCQHVLYWSNMNPEYDYYLFNDDAMDNFIQLEYGNEIFSSYACVKVGAAMCDVWRILIVYLFGGLYFDFDTRLVTPLDDWKWGNDVDVVTGRSCNLAKHNSPFGGGCAHQWGLVYAPKHPVLHAAIVETLSNLAQRTAKHVYDISFWSYYNAWRNSSYNQSYTPGWGEAFGGRIRFQDNDVKDVMVEGEMHWVKQKQIWHSECL